MSSPNDLGSCRRRKIVAGGSVRFKSDMPCAFSAAWAPPSSAVMAVAVAFVDGGGDRGQRGDHGADRHGGASLIVDCGDDAVILQLELLVERQSRQRPLLKDRKGAEDGAGGSDRQRNGEDQAGCDRSKFEHGGCRSSARKIGSSQKLLNNTGHGAPVLLRAGRPYRRDQYLQAQPLAEVLHCAVGGVPRFPDRIALPASS